MLKPKKVAIDPKRRLRSAQLRNVSKKYVEDADLRDPPARLYRAILNKLDMNPVRWGNYLRDYLDWVVTTPDREKARAERTTRTGNIKDTYFQKPSLTFGKLLEGLSILQMDSCEIIIRAKDKQGHVIEVSEEIRIMGQDRGSPIVEEPPED